MAGGGATAAGMGHLAVMDDSEPQFALTSYSQHLWHELAPELPRDAEYLACGSLWVAADEEELAEVHRKHRYYTAKSTPQPGTVPPKMGTAKIGTVPTQVLDSKQLGEAEPNLRDGMAGALLMSADSVCYPPCAARYLLNQVTQSGGEIFYNQPVQCLTGTGILTTTGLTLDAGAVILAVGTAATRLLPDLPLVPRKGHLVITDRAPGFLHHQIIELGYLKSAHATTADSVAFNAQPRITGQILLGSSRQFGPEDPTVEHGILTRMLARAVDYMPGLRGLSALRTWTGFRAATPDKLPLIGRVPGRPSLYLAAGHEGLGISTSLATARLLADEIAGRPSAIDRTPYRPDRSFAHHA